MSRQMARPAEVRERDKGSVRKWGRGTAVVDGAAPRAGSVQVKECCTSGARSAAQVTALMHARPRQRGLRRYHVRSGTVWCSSASVTRPCTVPGRRCVHIAAQRQTAPVLRSGGQLLPTYGAALVTASAEARGGCNGTRHGQDRHVSDFATPPNSNSTGPDLAAKRSPLIVCVRTRSDTAPVFVQALQLLAARLPRSMAPDGRLLPPRAPSYCGNRPFVAFHVGE